MANAVGDTIEKIKLQEQAKEAKLKVKRETEATIANLNRAIRETALFNEKVQHDQKELVKRTDTLRTQLEIARIHREALVSHIETLKNQLEQLRAECDQGITKVWELRSSLSTAVQAASDDCDIWALLIKPVCKTAQKPARTKPDESFYVAPIPLSDNRLRCAFEKRDKALVERNRLLSEPEEGEEFVRIKNALRYSLEMTANLRK